jgi:hypothetical protein
VRPAESPTGPTGVTEAATRYLNVGAFRFWFVGQRSLAKQLLAEVATLISPTAAVQNQFDHLLLTVHERIEPESGRGAD